jgi:hypothetical protein
MSQQQETATDRLVKVIQAVQIGRRTGVLTARRGEGVTLEEGTVSFVNGQVMEASAGRRSGSEALNWLSAWSHCRYTFTPSTASESASPAAGTFDIAEQETIDTTPLVKTSSQPSLLGRQTSPLLPVDEDAAGLGPPDSVTHSSIVPYRTRQIDAGLRIMESVGLSRSHRHLFLLIDGHRSMTELIRLMGRGQQEINALLQDLEMTAIIRIVYTPPGR